MIIIQGEMGSGKSKLAMDLLKHKKKGLYLILDKDHSVIQRLKKEKMDYTFMTNCLLMDIKYRILERGGLMNNDLDYVVVDSLNKIKDTKSYLEKIKYLQEVEKDFGIKIILTHNILRMLDKIPKKLKDIDGLKIIEVRRP
jgi:deoxyadenosine/deoxycytidine kinase